ncbi:UNVERIFIED_CONTAM: hypothetical protein Sradi_2966700 [Sesamum radiatum]|uniref:CCHC-type domain-containing protein n=1 Tax=Sesamum radiatum TaxID=300843 RepID=A0AAW2RZZ5_SESRA
MVPQWRHSHKNLRYWISLHSKRKLSFVTSPISSSSGSDDNTAASKQPQLGYDPSEELLGLAVDLQPSSPLKVMEDDEVDNLDIKLEVRRKTKRVYQSSAPEVNLKISRSLKSLNAKTGIFSKRMKIIHKDPKLHAQRVAAIKKTKGTPDARKRASESMKSYFSDPENRRKRSFAMRGIKFYCRNCGLEGHRRNYCPEIQDKVTDRRFRCRLCGEKGHNRRTCPRSKSNDRKDTIHRNHRCKICGQSGHNQRTCPQLAEVDSTVVVGEGQNVSRRNYTCRLCHEKGHNIRTCPHRK